MLSRRQFIHDTSLAMLALPLLRWEGLGTGSADPIEIRAGLHIHRRDDWGADLPPKGPLAAEDVRFLIVHHTTGANDYAAEDVTRKLRSYYDYHTSAAKGWNDIAYNFLIDREGRIWEGRKGSLDGPVAGDATGGNQGFTQLCCVIGDFATTLPTPEALASLTVLLAWLADRYDVDTSPGATTRFESRGSSKWSEGTLVETPTIAGHRDMSSGTTCPGDAFYPYVSGELAARVHSLREPPPTTTTLQSATLPSHTTVLPSTTPGTTGPPTTVVPTTTPPSPAQLPGIGTTEPLVAAPAAEVGDTDGGGVKRTLLAVGSIAAAAGATAAFVKARHQSGDERVED